MACGRRFDVGTPVVLWFEPGGYSAYDTASEGDGRPGLRYRPGRATPSPDLDRRIRAGDLEALREAVELFVVHYDACGTSRACFRVLQERGLSVHFLLDLDGTIYQTLDLAEQAWHARHANPRSIGVEIANVGAFPPDDSAGLEQLDVWYESVDGETRVVLPAEVGDGGLLREDASLKSVRSGRVVGRVQGKTLVQHDLTLEQYEALARLTAGLCRIFPRLALDVPRDESGGVRATALTKDELALHRGLVGHHHVTEDKVDPGPAFDWERLLEAARLRRGP